MSAAEYWDGDPILVRDYRRAHKIKRQMDNQQAWLQGLYFYDALGAMAPVLRAFAKAGTKALPYVKEPFPLETENKSKAEEESHDKKVYDKGMAWMRALMAGTKKKYGKKGGNADGNDDR